MPSPTIKDEVRRRIFIIYNFPREIRLQLVEKCPQCLFFDHKAHTDADMSACRYGLVPVTTRGEACPYFTLRPS